MNKKRIGMEKADKQGTSKAVPEKGSASRLIVAKLIALFSFGFVMLFLMTEVCTMGMYGLPYLTTEIARNVGVQSGSDWVVGSILWWFPSLFLTIILAVFHVYLIKAVVKKMWKWLVSVMRKSVDKC